MSYGRNIVAEYWIQTFTGKKVNLLNPTEDMICIEDIAHHLSQVNRFAGACKFPYSVAYHSIMVCDKASKHFKLDALLHEAEEAYVGDLTTQLKNALGREMWNKLVEPLGKVICRKFDVIDRTSLLYEPNIKAIDVRMVNTERHQLLTIHIPDWPPEFEKAEIYEDVYIHEVPAHNTEEAFLLEYNKWKRTL